VINVSIGSESRDGIDEAWINDQLKRHLRDGSSPCIQISVSDLGLRLSTRNCPGTGGGGRLNARQQALADEWNGLLRKHDKLNAGTIISFLKQVAKKL
jgi:hypothetical protein